MTWSTDPRLQGASAVKLTAAQIRAVLKALHMPTLLLLAEETSGQLPGLAEHARRHIESLTVRTIEGGHHFHMEPQVGEVARCMDQFLSGTGISESA